MTIISSTKKKINIYLFIKKYSTSEIGFKSNRISSLDKYLYHKTSDCFKLYKTRSNINIIFVLFVHLFDK